MDRHPAAWSYARCHGSPHRGHRRLLPALPRHRGPPGRRLNRPEPRPLRASNHTTRKTASGSTARQSPAVGTRPPRALLRPDHGRARPGRPQTLEATDALDPSPRPPARHLPSHRRSCPRPHRHRLKAGTTRPNTPPAITHQLVKGGSCHRLVRSRRRHVLGVGGCVGDGAEVSRTASTAILPLACGRCCCGMRRLRIQ